MFVAPKKVPKKKKKEETEEGKEEENKAEKIIPKLGMTKPKVEFHPDYEIEETEDQTVILHPKMEH